MSFNLTSSLAIIGKAGAGASSVAIASGALLASWCDMAEGRLVAETRKNWITASSSITANIRGLLDDVVSSLAAENLIGYDMSGYTDILEAQSLLDINDNRAKEGLKILDDQTTKTFLGI